MPAEGRAARQDEQTESLDAQGEQSHPEREQKPANEERAIQGMKEAAEAVLRELPSVIGASVKEDVFGNPREIHLLVRAGPNPRHLAYDVRDLLEERLGIPVDQRVISIAQIAPGKEPGPRLSGSTGTGEPTVEGAAVEEAAAAASRAEPRVLFHGVSTDAMDGRVRVRVRLELDDVPLSQEAPGVDTPAGRSRAASAAVLTAINETCVGRARFEVEHASVVDALERAYVLIAVLVSSPFLGRRPVSLVGAHPVELDHESAAVLATLKAINRTLSLVLRFSEGSGRAVRRAGRG
jgi:hypothetical protein